MSAGLPRLIIVFARAPVPGEVKTRLIPALGAEGAADLHASLVESALSAASGAAGEKIRVELWCAPDSGHAFFARCAGRFGAVLRDQGEGDLGRRMAGAFGDALRRAARVILIGSDLPCIDAGYLQQAFDALEDADAVLGPAEDGGYGLVGLKREIPGLFRDVAWGTGRVMEETRERLRQAAAKWHETEPLWDVDRPEDLSRLSFRPPISRRPA